jgi:hypothetical protein
MKKDQCYLVYNETQKLFVSESAVSYTPGEVSPVDGATARVIAEREREVNPDDEIRVLFYDEAVDMWMQES